MGFLNKKGQSVRDGILFTVMILVLGIGFLLVHTINSNMKDMLMSHPVLNASADSRAAFGGIDIINSKLDYITLVIFIGFFLAAIVIGYFIPVESIWMWIYIFVMLFGVAMSIVITTIWEKFSTHSLLLSAANALPITNHLITFLPIYYTLFGAVAIIFTYAKPGASE